MAIISIPTSVGGVALPGAIGQIASGPLAALFGNRALTTLNYPTELATDATKSHYVTFSIKEIISVGYETKSVAAAGSGERVGGSPEAGNFVNKIVSSEVGQTVIKNLDEVGGSIGTRAGQALVTAAGQGIAIKPQTTVSKAVISLYMPDTLIQDYKADWTEVNLEDVLGTKIQTLRTIGQIASSAGVGVKSGDAATFGAISNDPRSIALALQGAGVLAKGIGAGSDLGNVLLQGQGISINPQVQMLYRGLTTRSFTLSFTFSPKSKKEAKTVDDIIYNFKYYAAPAFTSGATVSSQSMYLTPPALFGVRFFSNGKENTFLPRYTDCVLENIDLNFAPNGFAAHADGAPIQTQLTLQFREIEIVDKGRLEKGHNGSNADEGLR